MRYDQLTKRDKRAVRAFRRVLDERTKGWDKGEAYDAHFDGGEWSGPAWARSWEAQADATAEFVSERFDLNVNRLLEAVFILDNVEVLGIPRRS